MNFHIYRVAGQPFIKWRIGTNILERASPWFRNDPRGQHRCHHCYRLRYARNLMINVYYDHSSVFCKGGCEKSTYKERYGRLRKWRADSAKGEPCSTD